MPVTFLIRPYPRTNDPKDVEKWFNELRRAALKISATTDGLAEGSTNLYFTTARARAAISAGAPITYNPTTGVVDIALGNGLVETLGVLIVNKGNGLKFTSSVLEVALAANKGLEILTAEIAAKINATNLQFTAGAINTIQDISTTSSPTFAKVTAGSGGNDTVIDALGVKQEGTARTWNDFNFPALTLHPGATAPTVGNVGPSGSILGLLFGGTGVTVDSASGGDEIKHDYCEGTTIKVHVHWSPTTADAGDVKWFVEFMWTNVNETDAAPTTISAVQAASGTAWAHQIVNISDVVGTGKHIGSNFQFRIYRDPADAQDTYAHPAELRSVGIHFEQDTLGSRQVASKT